MTNVVAPFVNRQLNRDLFEQDVVVFRLAGDAGLGDGLLDDVTCRRVFRHLENGVRRLEPMLLNFLRP